METPTVQQLDEMIADLKEQLENCSDDTIMDELIQEIKYREQQKKDLTTK